MSTLYLFNRDLRLKDNKALERACEEELINFAIAIKETKDWGESKKQFYFESVENLKNNLNKLGHELYQVHENDFKALEGIDRVIMTKNYNSKELPLLNSYTGEVIEVEQSTLFSIEELPFSLKNLPQTFTPFRHKMDKVKKIPCELKSQYSLPKRGGVNLSLCSVSKLSEVNTKFKGGEDAGQARLNYYFSKKDLASHYFETRNGMLDFDDSTKFSPWLSWGCISANTIYHKLKNYEKEYGANKSSYWIFFELLWRDYFKFLSLQKGDLIFDLKGTARRELEFHPDQDQLFKQWKEAKTEEDFVNANMNELNENGWMSNRGRQNVASFLAKTYKVNWLWGAKYFENHLIDADLESNQGNWGYLAGVGVDPRDRKFNIERQQSIYDPEGEYIKKYSPKNACL